MADLVASPTIVALGDSITAAAEVMPSQRWPHLLERRFEADGTPCRVVNSGVGGETTAMGLARFDADVLGPRPHIVTVEFGFNDCHIADGARPRTSTHQFRENQLQIGTRILDDAEAALFFITNHPTLIFDPQADGRPYDASSRAYNEITRGVAGQLGAALIDVERAWDATAMPLEELLNWDLIHLSARGNQEYARVVGDVLAIHLTTA